MGALVRSDIVAAVNAIVQAAPYNFSPAREPFGFDLQPETHLDAVYCLLVEAGPADDYFGYAQAQIDYVTVRLARKVRRDAFGAVASLTADCTSLTSSMIRAGTTYDFNAAVPTWKLPAPAADDDYAVAEISITVDYDLAL